MRLIRTLLVLGAVFCSLVFCSAASAQYEAWYDSFHNMYHVREGPDSPIADFTPEEWEIMREQLDDMAYDIERAPHYDPWPGVDPVAEKIIEKVRANGYGEGGTAEDYYERLLGLAEDEGTFPTWTEFAEAAGSIGWGIVAFQVGWTIGEGVDAMLGFTGNEGNVKELPSEGYGLGRIELKDCWENATHPNGRCVDSVSLNAATDVATYERCKHFNPLEEAGKRECTERELLGPGDEEPYVRLPLKAVFEWAHPEVGGTDAGIGTWIIGSSPECWGPNYEPPNEALFGYAEPRQGIGYGWCSPDNEEWYGGKGLITPGLAFLTEKEYLHRILRAGTCEGGHPGAGGCEGEGVGGPVLTFPKPGLSGGNETAHINTPSFKAPNVQKLPNPVTNEPGTSTKPGPRVIELEPIPPAEVSPELLPPIIKEDNKEHVFPEPAPEFPEPSVPELPEPLVNELATSYKSKIEAAGWTSVEIRTLPETAIDPATGPSDVAYTEPSGRVEQSTQVIVEANPSDAPVPGGPVGGTIIGPEPPGLHTPNFGVLCEKFPFGVPCWLYEEFSGWITAREAPKWEVPLEWTKLGFKKNLVLSLSPFESAMEFIRPILIAVSTIGLIFLFYRFATGGSPSSDSGSDDSSGEL